MDVQVVIPLGRWLSGILKNNISKLTSRYLLQSNTFLHSKRMFQTTLISYDRMTDFLERRNFHTIYNPTCNM